MSTFIFDIETGPLPTEQVESVMPAFDPAEVKTGNLKDPAKVAEKIEQARSAHRQSFIDRAALDPMTGQVLAMGYITPAGAQEIEIGDENMLLTHFWGAARQHSGQINRLVGFNICLFDLPFLIRRSWHHGIPIPVGVRNGRYWDKNIVDLRDTWQLGNRQAHGSLDAICKFLGLGEKLGDGKDFARLLVEDREQAVAYLKHDLELTRLLAQRLGEA